MRATRTSRPFIGALLIALCAIHAVAGDDDKPKAPLDEQRIEEWIAQLGSNDAQKAKRAHEVIVTLITDPKSDLAARDADAHISRDYDLRNAMEKFLGALGDAPDAVSKRMVFVLGDIAKGGGYLGDTKFYSSQVMERDKIAERIASFGPSMIPPLVEIVRFGGGNDGDISDYRNESVGYVAALALARLGADSIEPLLGVLTRKTTASLELRGGARFEGQTLAAFALGRIPAAHDRAIHHMADFLCIREARHLRGAAMSAWRWPTRRHHAFKGTGEKGVRALAERLGNDVLDPFARIELLLALRAMGQEAEAAVPAIRAIADDATMSETVRQVATRTLGQIRTSATIAPLMAALLDEDNKARWDAQWELEKMGAPAIAAMLPLLDTKERGHRITAIRMLGEFGAVAHGTTPRLMKLLDDEDVRGFALMALARIHSWSVKVPDALIERMVAFAKDKDETPRSWGVAALSELASAAKPAADVLRDIASNDGSAQLRRAAVLALAKVAPDRLTEVDIPHFIDEIREDMAWRRTRAKQAIENLEPALRVHLVPHLEKALSVWRTLPLGDVLEVLGMIGPAAVDAVPAIERLANQPPRSSGLSRSRAIMALWRVRPDGVQRAMRVIDASLDKGRAFDTTLRLGTADPLKALVEIGPRARAAVPVLLRVLEQEGDRFGLRKGTAAEALGAIGAEPDRVVPLLVSLLNEREKWIRHGAIKGLTSFGPKAREALPHLVRVLDDPDEYVRADTVLAMRKIGAETVMDALLGALEDEAAFVRRRAAYALGQLGSKASSAVSVLEALLSDRELAVQREAFVALWSIRGAPPRLPGQDAWK